MSESTEEGERRRSKFQFNFHTSFVHAQKPVTIKTRRKSIEMKQRRNDDKMLLYRYKICLKTVHRMVVCIRTFCIKRTNSAKELTQMEMKQTLNLELQCRMSNLVC